MSDDVYKVELETTFEALLIVAVIACFIISLLCLNGYLSSHASSRSPIMLISTVGALILAVFLYICRKFTDCFYLVNEKEKSIYYHFQFFSYEKTELFKRADELYAVAVSGEDRESKTQRWYGYSVVLIDDFGEKIFFSDELRDDKGLLEANAFAEKVAKSLELEVFKGKSEHKLVIEDTDEDFEVKIVARPLPKK